MKTKPHRIGIELAAATALAGLHTFVTLWYRLPILAAAWQPGGLGRAELPRMLAEKVGAMIDGALEAQRELARFGAAAATGTLCAADVATIPTALAAAGFRPAFRQVRANSARLHSRGRRKRRAISAP